MYVTRTYSQLHGKNGYFNSEALAEVPEGPNLGFLVIKDEDEYDQGSCCFGWFKWKTMITRIRELPPPQNKDLTLTYHDDINKKFVSIPIIFIPVLNQPLSSNRYYAIKPEGRFKGGAFTCTRKKHTHTNPMPLNPQNIYQQVEIFQHEEICCYPPNYVQYGIKSVASDGFRPYVTTQYDAKWNLYPSTPYQFELSEARGIDYHLRARLPNLDCSLLCKSTKPVIVGKWYCPFMFVKDGRVRDQVERSMYYVVTLEQRWEQVFAGKRTYGSCNSVTFDVEKEQVEKNADDGVIWFTSYETEGGDLGVGLRVEVIERMKWEQERGGWEKGKDRKVKIERVEEFQGDWNQFACYVLVERFNFRRMDGSLAMAYDFKHTHQIKTIFE
ncbi:hypothetical protein ACJIZ3_022587 [Penstemon smallii]|uniref:Insecticidal crystal toxin domain-containing protein n=1 Tax=Penstemon smallii TaxID=265156 RepID=A0ABD3TLN6_9LAMI